jgi:outer membrane protein OmpA-like peptidoglycan-associated protein
MKIFSVLLLLVAFPALVQAQGDEPDLAVTPKRSSRPAKKKPETQATIEVKKPARPSLIQIDRETKKIVTPKIHFLPTQTNLTPLAKKVLKHLVQELSAESGLQIQIEAHTDELGSDRFNQELSQQQADAVKAFLVESGVATTRLQAVGRGDTALLDEGRTPLAQAKNRRVEFAIMGETAAPETLPPAAIETQPENTPTFVLPPPPTPETTPTMPAPSIETLPTTQPETTPTSVLPVPPPPTTPTPTATIPVISLPTIPTTPETRP